MKLRTQNDSPVVVATFGAMVLMAGQVAAKATRDALFLSQFGVKALPIVVIAAALVSIIASVVMARLNRSLLPYLFPPLPPVPPLRS